MVMVEVWINIRMPKPKYTPEDLKLIVPTVVSIAQLLRKVGLKPAGGNYASMHRILQELKIDTSHFKGQGWNKDSQQKDWSDYTRVTHLKKHLMKSRGCKCEDCNNEHWKDNPIPLEVHHKDGDRTNNSETNLQLLCPNCHATTHNWRGRKNKNL